ncbi:hypothetical protein GN244_ATG12173 [Phytophthora infestans]|uniref:Uncharacterized protein n=1 Tax=Phytophthora infestans TaxID=4787 RepID=A0A833WI14_PHYIN|nr:hypothetical protein GN244_ATG12173 [Phytophthora infestans]KAF4146025.1 hypothetical protein GN958_ATG04781 [Phytophthora infestans]KAF4150164.1 hypothetical protein GN958_ATG00585 [Phytophthora infestans]
MGQASPHPDALIDKMAMTARAKLSKDHYEIYKKMHNPIDLESPSPDQSPSNESVAPRSSRTFLFDSPVPSLSKSSVRKSHLLEEVEKIVYEWMRLLS